MTTTVLAATPFGYSISCNPAAYTLSGGNLTITGNTSLGGSNWGQAYCYDPRRSGKYYVEVKLINEYLTVGVGSPSMIVGLIDRTATGYGHVLNNGNMYIQGSGTGYSLGGFSVGDVLGIACDFDNGLYWMRRNGGLWNGDTTANPVTGVHGVSMSGLAPPYVIIVESEDVSVLTANFGASAYAFSAPTGFGIWNTVNALSLTTAAAPDGVVSLTGTTTLGTVTAIDCSLDGGSTWNLCQGFFSGNYWNIVGPKLTTRFFGYVEVRDDPGDTSISNSLLLSYIPGNLPPVAVSGSGTLSGGAGGPPPRPFTNYNFPPISSCTVGVSTSQTCYLSGAVYPGDFNIYISDTNLGTSTSPTATIDGILTLDFGGNATTIQHTCHVTGGTLTSGTGTIIVSATNTAGLVIPGWANIIITETGFSGSIVTGNISVVTNLGTVGEWTGCRIGPSSYTPTSSANIQCVSAESVDGNMTYGLSVSGTDTSVTSGGIYPVNTDTLTFG